MMLLTKSVAVCAISVVLAACGPANDAPRTAASPSPVPADPCGAIADAQIAALNRTVADVGKDYDRWVESGTPADSKAFLKGLRKNDFRGPKMPGPILRAFDKLDAQRKAQDAAARRAGCSAGKMARLRRERVGDIQGAGLLADMFRFVLVQPPRG